MILEKGDTPTPTLTTGAPLVSVESLGRSGVASGNDIEVVATNSGAPSSPSQAYPLASLAPRSLNPTGDNCYPASNGYNGYNCYISYTMLDQRGNPLPSINTYINEYFFPPVYKNKSVTPNTWVRPPQCGSTGSCAELNGNNFNDQLFYEDYPPPNNVYSPVAEAPYVPGAPNLMCWIGYWSVGSPNPGEGARVQYNSWNFYEDHGTHEGISSPPTVAPTCPF